MTVTEPPSSLRVTVSESEEEDRRRTDTYTLYMYRFVYIIYVSVHMDKRPLGTLCSVWRSGTLKLSIRLCIRKPVVRKLDGARLCSLEYEVNPYTQHKRD